MRGQVKEDEILDAVFETLLVPFSPSDEGKNIYHSYFNIDETNCPLETYFGLCFHNSIQSHIDVYVSSMTIQYSYISMINSTTRCVCILHKFENS